MKRVLIAVFSVVAVTGVFAVGMLHAQQPPAQPHDMSKMVMPAAPAGAEAETPEIFCPTMKTGQLCSHGTTDALQLSGAKADQWLAAVNKYNRAVDQATKQLQDEVKDVLTPQQAVELQRWFAVGLNPEMNKILQQSTTTSTKKK